MPQSVNAHSKSRTISLILITGFLAGTLDISAACIQYYINTGKSPVNVLNYIARGLLGNDAASGGAGVALLGLFCHYLIAFSFTFFFAWMYPKWKWLSVNRLLTAIVYGLFVWAVMNLVVVRLSRITPGPFHLNKAAMAALILICMIGLPLSFILGNHFDHRKER